MKRNKTKVSDHYVMVSSRSTFCEGYSEPTFSTWFDYGLAHQAVKAELLKLCAMGWTISKTEVEHDENGRRKQWHLVSGDDGHDVHIVRVSPEMIEPDVYAKAEYLVYDQQFNTWDLVFGHMETRLHMANQAMHSKGYDQEFMKFNQETNEIYKEALDSLVDLDEGLIPYITIDEDDNCLHYYKMKFLK